MKGGPIARRSAPPPFVSLCALPWSLCGFAALSLLLRRQPLCDDYYDHLQHGAEKGEEFTRVEVHSTQGVSTKTWNGNAKSAGSTPTDYWSGRTCCHCWS